MGVDLFFHSPEPPRNLPAQVGALRLRAISNRGVPIDPHAPPERYLLNWYRALPRRGAPQRRRPAGVSASHHAPPAVDDHSTTLSKRGAAALQRAAGGVKAMAAFQSAFLFPPNRWHNHAPSIVECPNGDLLVCWFSGSGEREADDVQILGARKRAHHSKWSQPFLMADTPNYPDCNPCLFIDPRQRLWLVWITILNHRWEGSLLKYRRTRLSAAAGSSLAGRRGVPHLARREVRSESGSLCAAATGASHAGSP